VGISEKTQAILLLTMQFSREESPGVKPLTPGEYKRLSAWMRDNRLSPELLLREQVHEVLRNWKDKTASLDRIEALIKRSSALALATEKWLRAGLWVVSRSEQNYPAVLWEHLNMDSPPVLFGCGNIALLRSRGIAVVGSRNAEADDLSFSESLGGYIADSGYSVVSGGAKGVDETAMIGALRVGGTAIGILSNSLLRVSTSSKYRHHLMEKNLVLVSPFNPEARFQVWNAMNRNKLIYCLASAAIVVHSGKKGGTWTGALENIKHGWVPLWVKKTKDSNSGNSAIVKAGATWLPPSMTEVSIDQLSASVNSAQTLDLFSSDASKRGHLGDEGESRRSGQDAVGRKATTIYEEKKHNDPQMEVNNDSDLQITTFFQLFLRKLRPTCTDREIPLKELQESFELKNSQLVEWLGRAVDEGYLEKLARPVRYRWKSTRQTELPILRNDSDNPN